mmetsp:Transcript_24579/g.71905  ORF Transcript_24579/g.71905 Transcript_24579/m.71905 type:complete len:82 (+) Transcript_24579:104-349(+)
METKKKGERRPHATPKTLNRTAGRCEERCVCKKMFKTVRACIDWGSQHCTTCVHLRRRYIPYSGDNMLRISILECAKMRSL